MNSVDKVSENFFLVVGSGRSGTTLLKSMLSCHQSVHIPPETFFYTSIFKDGGRRDSVESLIKTLKSKWWIQSRVSDWSCFERRVKESSLNSVDAAFFSLLMEGAEQDGITLFGEKTPAHVFQAERFLRDYPAARVIHIVRDPRAIYASYKKMIVGYQYPLSFVNNWKRVIEIHNKLNGNPKYMSVRYEDLILDTVNVIEKIQSFLALPISSSVLDFAARDQANFEPEQKHHAETLKPIFTGSIANWQWLPINDIQFIEAHLSEEMASLGYEVGSLDLKKYFFLECKYLVMEFFHRNFIRRPYQLNKRILAKIRFRK
ncbi:MULTISPECIES: sulfotransferase [unclassified Neptuniibacter]|uniref:sulfotransferase family protein n=1 Tax=unclassified Neptuniibacter TaxID=2630693 RepID=UPI000C60E068|nr:MULTISPECIES: sulfotransferase [unclassified Neptuniibacter]MAY42194.1 hypothetical protein [Oceanospirillaceae bacterium]|tara:strand:+ start:6277 stop:7227 length:951 start_codon:yes stop_codon:yes gene_type:complete